MRAADNVSGPYATPYRKVTTSPRCRRPWRTLVRSTRTHSRCPRSLLSVGCKGRGQRRCFSCPWLASRRCVGTSRQVYPFVPRRVTLLVVFQSLPLSLRSTRCTLKLIVWSFTLVVVCACAFVCVCVCVCMTGQGRVVTGPARTDALRSACQELQNCKRKGVRTRVCMCVYVRDVSAHQE